jgi:hypothetical protein
MKAGRAAPGRSHAPSLADSRGIDNHLHAAGNPSAKPPTGPVGRLEGERGVGVLVAFQGVFAMA